MFTSKRTKTTSTILETSSLPQSGPYHTLDPFLFCVYHKDAYPAANNDKMEAPRRGNGHDFNPKAPYRMYHGDKIPGFPQHPHRGFETVTATIDGLIDHSDSKGNCGRYGEGDVQWMTAGKGVCHCEMFPLINKDKPNDTRFFQLWLNLPRKHKMVEPNFAMFWANDVPKYESADGLTSATVFFGDYFLNDNQKERVSNPNEPPQHSWAADRSNDVAIMHFTIKPGGTLIVPKAHVSSVNRSLYLIEGFDGVQVNEKEYKKPVMLTVNASNALEIKLHSAAQRASEFLLLQGKPIDETVVQHGPFVMNTQNEISEAYSDYRKTKFGGWPWPRNDMVLPRHKGRFALLNGKETSPSDSDNGLKEQCNDEEKTQ